MTLDTTQPFTRRVATKAGIGVSHLVGRNYRRLFHGIYIGSQVQVNLAVRARAALLIARPGSYVSHHTAAVLWGGWAPPVTQVHLSTAEETRSRRRGIVAHRAGDGVVPVLHRGLPLAPASQVFLDLAAAGVDLVDLVAVGDSLVRAGVVAPAELTAAAAGDSGPGSRRARRAAGWVREGVDSVMETRLRMLIVLAGLPEPVVNHILRDEDGRWVWRLDLSYPGLQLVIEYDGRQHAENTTQWRKDLRRREQLEDQGWKLIVITAEDVFGEPQQTLDRIRTALRDRGESAGRHRPPPEWFRCFPGRSAA